MNFDEKRAYVQDKRREAREAGCKSCQKQTMWLILEGGPSLFDMLRTNASVEVLDEAMAKRGWYCRACIAGRSRRALHKRAEVASEAAKSRIFRKRSVEFLDEASRDPNYEPYSVPELSRRRYAEEMVGALLDGQATDAEEAFFLVSAARQNEVDLSPRV